MASIYRDSSRNGWRVQLYVRGVRRKLWLGPLARAQAMAVARHLDALNLARDTGTTPPAATAAWLTGVSPRIRGRLVTWGLIAEDARAASIPRTLDAYLAWYIADHPEWRERTRLRWANVRRHATQQIGSGTSLESISAGSADAFSRAIRAAHSSSHAGKLLSDMKQAIAAAVANRLLPANPFAGIDTTQRHDADRAAYVTADTTLELLAAACPYYAALIAVARWGGLRVPSEPLQLQWQHIDWDTGRILVHSPKTHATRPTRHIPLFPQLRPELQTLWDAAPDGSRYVFDRYRATASKVWRAGLLRICTAAGIVPWPKLWVNLRASCRTDLLATYPVHVVDHWLGHDARIGAKHYDRVPASYYTMAVGSPVGSPARSLPPAPARRA